jgi:uncharacterized membrane protein YfcA
VHLDIAAAGLIVGLIIGLTGMGGGALMTPVLVIFFKITPSAAISSDVMASVVLKPVGGTVHARRGTVNWRMVRWLAIGSAPAAFLGAWAVNAIGGNVENNIKYVLGVVLLIAAAAILAKLVVQRNRPRSDALLEPHEIRPLPTLAVGILGGFIVGLTSVGSGSLMIVMLMLLYPTLTSREMVGTDMVQAIPLVAAAALGHFLFGSISLGLTGSVLIGAIPGVYVGAHLSARANDRYIRPVLVAVLAISAVKLLNATNAELLGATVIAVATLIALFAVSWFRRPITAAEAELQTTV